MRRLSIIIALIMFSFTYEVYSKDLIQSLTSKLQKWDAEGAWQEIKDYIQSDVKDPEILEIASRIAFFRGRYQEALRLIKTSIEVGGDDIKKRNLSLFIEQTIEACSSFKRYETSHFIIDLDNEKDGILIDYIKETLESTYKIMADRYGFIPEEKVRVEIFPDSKGFYYASSLSAKDIEMGAVGQAEFNKLMILSPGAVVHGYRWLDAISHEYMHYLIVKMTANNAPIWFHEGFAKYEETRWRNGPSYLSALYETLISRALRDQKLIRFERMEPSLVKLDTPEDVQLAYAQSASAIEFIISRFGHEGLREIMKRMALKENKGAEEPIREVMGLTFDQFERDWKEFLIIKGLKEVRGINLKRYKVKEGRADEERMDMEEIKSLLSRNRAHLGDLLRERGRRDASIIEYRKALSDEPESVPVLNRLSSLLIELGRNEEALELLKKATRINPDHPTIYINLGRLYLKLNDYKKAKDAFKESIEINPFNPEAHIGLAKAYEMLNEGFLASKEREIFNKLIK